MFLELLLKEMLEVQQLLINIVCCQHLSDVVGGNLVEQRLSLLLHNPLDNCFELSHQGDRILLGRFQPLFNARSLKSTHTAHMCGGPKKVGRTKKLVD